MDNSIFYVTIYFLFYAFIAAILSLWIFVLICKCYRSSPQYRATVAPPPAPPLHVGLDSSVIDTLPTFKFAGGEEGSSNLKSRSECVVCLGAFEDNETLRLMPRCGHVFHSNCVDVWLRSHATCPYCRSAVAPPRGLLSSEVQILVVTPPPPLPAVS